MPGALDFEVKHAVRVEPGDTLLVRRKADDCTAVRELLKDYPNILCEDVDIEQGFHLETLKIATEKDTIEMLDKFCNRSANRKFEMSGPVDGWVVNLWYKRAEGDPMGLRDRREIEGVTAEQECKDCLVGIRSFEEYYLLTRKPNGGEPLKSYFLEDDAW